MNKKMYLVLLSLSLALPVPQAQGMGWAKKKIATWWYGKKETKQTSQPTTTDQTVFVPEKPTTEISQPSNINLLRESTLFSESKPLVKQTENTPALEKIKPATNKQLLPLLTLKKLMEGVTRYYKIPETFSVSIPESSPILQSLKDDSGKELALVFPNETHTHDGIDVAIPPFLFDENEQEITAQELVKTARPVHNNSEEQETTIAPGYEDTTSQIKKISNKSTKMFNPSDHFTEYTTAYPKYHTKIGSPANKKQYNLDFPKLNSTPLSQPTKNHPLSSHKKLQIIYDSVAHEEALRLGTIQHCTTYNYAHSEQLAKSWQLKQQKTLAKITEDTEISRLMNINTNVHNSQPVTSWANQCNTIPVEHAKKPLQIIYDQVAHEEALRLGTIQHCTTYNYAHGEHLNNLLYAAQQQQQQQDDAISELSAIDTNYQPKPVSVPPTYSLRYAPGVQTVGLIPGEHITINRPDTKSSGPLYQKIEAIV